MVLVSHVLIVGVGGTGSHLAEPLVRLLTFHEKSKDAYITFIDGDIYEPNNAERQLFRRQAIGKYKAQYQADNLRFLNPNIDSMVGYIDRPSLSTKLDSLRIGKDRTVLVIATVDNHQSRKQILLSLMSYGSFNWLLITPGNGLDNGQVLSYGFFNGEYQGMNPLDSYPDIKSPKDRIPRMDADCIEQSVSSPQLISANAFASLGTLLTIQSLLDTNSFPSEIHFDVRKAKMISNFQVTV